tara:strand:+ start:93 stop:335 length:243 start_codon:yes stop_codon:yes gene_type:complete
MENLHTLSLNELQQLKSEVTQMISMKSHNAFKVGMLVEIDGDKHRGQVFEITKVNKTRCKISCTKGYGKYTCPKSMLIIK